MHELRDYMWKVSELFKSEDKSEISGKPFPIESGPKKQLQFHLETDNHPHFSYSNNSKSAINFTSPLQVNSGRKGKKIYSNHLGRIDAENKHFRSEYTYRKHDCSFDHYKPNKYSLKSHCPYSPRRSEMGEMAVRDEKNQPMLYHSKYEMKNNDFSPKVLCNIKVESDNTLFPV